MQGSDVLALLGAAGFLVLAAKALAARRLAPAPVLLRFALAFLLLALAQAASVALSLSSVGALRVERDSVDRFDGLFWTYYGSLLAGFGLLLSTFTRRKLRLVLAVAPLLLVAGPLAQTLVVVLALLVVVHAGLNHIERAGAGSLGTTVGYALIFLAHATFLLDYRPLDPRHVLGDAIQLLGVATLLAVAYRRR